MKVSIELPQEIKLVELMATLEMFKTFTDFAELTVCTNYDPDSDVIELVVFKEDESNGEQAD